jgi:hypothetical protein
LRRVRTLELSCFDSETPSDELSRIGCSQCFAAATGCGGSGGERPGAALLPPTPAVGDEVAGTEPRRRRGGVRLMLKRVTY